VPSKDVLIGKGIDPDDGPSVQVEPEDHQKTGSWGNSKDAQDYRGQEKDLIDQGRWDDAIEKGIDDLKDKFDDKYDGAIEDMIDSLPDNWDDWENSGDSGDEK